MNRLLPIVLCLALAMLAGCEDKPPKPKTAVAEAAHA